MRTVKALARLRRCAHSPEPLLVAYVIKSYDLALIIVMTPLREKGTGRCAGHLLLYSRFVFSRSVFFPLGTKEGQRSLNVACP